MTERDDRPDEDGEDREFDIRWADDAERKEPSARARMLAARWKENPPPSQPFRAEAERGRRTRARSPWTSVALVFGIVAAVIVVLGYSGFRAPY
ncbi:hypothetical protein ACIPSE_17845 [Streptomyces sp. NPDC090106]|uniref:SCO2583/SCO2584 N-terminal domain-containing protein n=1 Tax=Streptomyces sp. NPDC090106 TaxID=3365946 RepID=UPI0037FF1462